MLVCKFKNFIKCSYVSNVQFIFNYHHHQLREIWIVIECQSIGWTGWQSFFERRYNFGYTSDLPIDSCQYHGIVSAYRTFFRHTQRWPYNTITSSCAEWCLILYEFISEFNWRRCIIRTVIVMIAVTIGEVIPRFDLLMGLIGALLTGPLMFLLPPLFYVKLRTLRRSKIKISEGVCYRTFPNAKLTPIVGFKHLTLLLFIILAGTLATILSTVSAIRDTINYAQFTPSCIMQLFVWINNAYYIMYLYYYSRIVL